MYSKEDLRKTILYLTRKTGKSQEDIAVEIGYNKNYISEILSPTGKITGKFQRALNNYIEDIDGSNTTKASIIPDVDAFVVTQLTKQTAILAVLLELAAEQEARFSSQPVTKILSDLEKAVSNKEEMMRAASTVKHGSS